MKSHLTSGQISQWVLGTRSRPVTRHIHSCPICRKEVGRFEEALTQFRTSVREWSDSQFDPRFPMPANLSESKSGIAFRASWAAVALALCVLVSVAVRRGVRQGEGRVAGGDAALLNQVDREVTRTVPGPMEPLVQLVAWDGNSAAETSTYGPDR